MSSFQPYSRDEQDHDSISSSSSHSSIRKLKPNLEAGSSKLVDYFRGVFSRQNNGEKVSRSWTSSSTKKLLRSESFIGWRPWTLRPLVLTLAASLTSSVIIFLGILQWFSDRDGGLFFANQISDLAVGPTFLYLYFPTLLAVIYSTGWTWVDLDAKRLEPWFQLAKPEGASGENSILLQYPIDFLALVPIKAARRKHWAVFCVSSIMVLVFWAVTPLQSGIFAVKNISKSASRTMEISPSLFPLAEQDSTLDVRFLNNGYGVAWLDQKLPAFTTRTYALAPFKPSGASVLDSSRKNLTWTSTTTLYETDLDCRPAIVSLNKFSFNFDDGQGCKANGIVPNTGTGQTPIEEAPTFNAYYIPYYRDSLATTSASLSTSGCSSNSSHEFLAVWMRSTVGTNFQNSSAFAALFCKPTYYSQPVQATVALPDRSVISTHPMAPRSSITDKDFNITLFEYILGTGVAPGRNQNVTSAQDSLGVRRDIAGTAMFDPRSLLIKKNIVAPASNMISFAIGKDSFEPEGLLNSTTLHTAFRAAHQLLFALAVQSVTQAPNASQSTVDGVEQYSVEAVTMVKVFTFLVQGFLTLIVLGTVYLALSYRRRKTALNVDPASISTLICFSHEGHELIDYLKAMDRTDGKDFFEDMKGVWAKTIYSTEMGQPTLDLGAQVDPPGPGDFKRTNSDDDFSHVLPVELHILTGVSLVLILAAAIGTLIFLRSKILQENGIRLPSENTVIQQLVTNYIPVAFGTLIEPVWVVLNRLLCITQAFVELRNRTSRASQSISLKYTSLPPQLAILRAFRARHFLLLILCGVAILANILTVALSGLFTIQRATQHQDMIVKQQFLPRLQSPNQTYVPSGELGVPLQNVISNISAGTPLPPWVSADTYFFPVEFPLYGNTQELLGYNLATVGVGAELDCHELQENQTNFSYRFDLSSDVTEANFSMTYEAKNGSIARCYASIGLSSDISNDGDTPNTQILILSSPVGTRALEMLVKAQPSFIGATAVEKGMCQNLIIGAWMRANITLQDKTGETINGPTANASSVSINKTFMACMPRTRSALFNITVDRNGSVLDSTQIKAVEQSVVGDMSSILDATTYLLTDQSASNSFIVWHNDSFASDWVSYLIKEMTHSAAITDPHAELPGYVETAKQFNEVYQRVFAATMGENSGFLVGAPDDDVVTVSQVTQESRIFISEVMFWVAISILLLDLVTAIALYTLQARAFLPRLPTSIASILAYVAASHTLDDLNKLGAKSYAEKMEYLEQAQQRYRFGEYVGTDGQKHIGLDRSEHLVTGSKHSTHDATHLRLPWRRSHS